MGLKDFVSFVYVKIKSKMFANGRKYLQLFTADKSNAAKKKHLYCSLPCKLYFHFYLHCPNGYRSIEERHTVVGFDLCNNVYSL